MFTAIVTTMDRYKGDVMTESGLIDTTKQSGSVKEYQKVVAIGSSVRDINVGDIVCIDPTRYAIKKHKEGSLKDNIITDNPVVSFNFDIVELNGEPHLLLQDRDITFVIEDYEE